MATKSTQHRDHTQDIGGIDAKAASTMWEDRLLAIEMIRSLLKDLPSAQTVGHILDVLGRLAKDSKWEVRKAVVTALLDTRHPAAGDIIDQLVGDANQWVRQAAERAKRKLARITTPAEKRDPRLEFAFAVVKDFKPKTPEEIYNVAIRISEKFYEELAADTAHELNTYLTSMEGYVSELELLLTAHAVANPQAMDALAKIKERFQYLKSLVKGLLEYARDMDVDFQSQPLRPMVEEALDLAKEKVGTQLYSRVRLSMAVPDELTLEVSRRHIVIALTNVLSNAFQSYENKEGEGDIGIKASVKDAERILIEVKDAGCGMDASGMESARKRFRSLRKDHGGIGLGLPLAIKIVERHGGRLDIESELGAGTTIAIELPVRQAERREHGA
jgi:signal transduction histidine kinase